VISPPIHWVQGALSPWVNWLGCEADHTPLSSAKVKNAWSYTNTLQYIFMVWCLIKQCHHTWLSKGTTLPAVYFNILIKTINLNYSALCDIFYYCLGSELCCNNAMFIFHCNTDPVVRNDLMLYLLLKSHSYCVKSHIHLH
jgi:hypothetical protein